MIHLQTYWWLLVSVLGAVLVFLLFVQGGQTLLLTSDPRKDLMVKSLGHKWELTFTTLVTFGGAFFASFPLFYSTSFGGAYWLWMLILFSFIFQAVSYEFRGKSGNIFGTRTYDIFLFVNGCMGTILLGVAVAMFFIPNDFTVDMNNLVGARSNVISHWGAAHGLEAICNWFTILMGVMVLFLARTLASLYFINNIEADSAFYNRMKRSVAVNGAIFVVLFLAFMAALLMKDGYQLVEGSRNEFEIVGMKYLTNYCTLWWTAVLWVAGVAMVLYALGRTVFSKKLYRKGIWWAGIGTILVVLTLFWVAGYNNTPYYPSADMASSLTIYNSSSSEFTLTVMSWVSILVPFVAGYIAYVWYAMDRKSNSRPIQPIKKPI